MSTENNKKILTRCQTLLENQLVIYPGSSQALRLVAKIKLNLGDTMGAEVALTHSLKLDSMSPEVLLILFFFKKKTKNYSSLIY
jgi:hypothetical protein